MVIQLETLNRDRIFTVRKRSLRQGNIFTGVCLFTGGVCCKRPPPVSVHIHRGWGWQTSPGQPPAPPPETATEAGGTHPTGIRSCFRFSLHVGIPSRGSEGRSCVPPKDQIFPPRGGGSTLEYSHSLFLSMLFN